MKRGLDAWSCRWQVMTAVVEVLFFLWGLTPPPHPHARSATLTKRDAKIFQIFTSQNFLSIFMDEGNNLDSCAYCDYQHDYYETKEEEA